MTDLSLLRNPLFLIPCLANLFAAIGLFIPFVYIVDRSVALGVQPETAAFLISVIGWSLPLSLCVSLSLPVSHSVSVNYCNTWVIQLRLAWLSSTSCMLSCIWDTHTTWFFFNVSILHSYYRLCQNYCCWCLKYARMIYVFNIRYLLKWCNTFW